MRGRTLVVALNQIPNREDKPTSPWAWRHGKGIPATKEAIGNHRSKVYHSPTCPSVGRVKYETKVTFKTSAEAEEKGYRRAGDRK